MSSVRNGRSHKKTTIITFPILGISGDLHLMVATIWTINTTQMISNYLLSISHAGNITNKHFKDGSAIPGMQSNVEVPEDAYFGTGKPNNKDWIYTSLSI